MSALGINSYNYMNFIKGRNSTSQTNLLKNKRNRVDRNLTSSNSNTEKFKGDMRIQQPPNYSSYVYDNDISGKSKSDMTMDEYKQYFMNEMSKIPVSSYYRASYTGSLVITEKAFEKMKTDPEYEKTVLNMLNEMYSVKGLPQRSYCMQIIGASPEETYGYTVPIDSDNSFLEFSQNKKSWWRKRHEKMEKLIQEQNKNAAEERLKQQKRYEEINHYKQLQFYNTNILK